MSAGMHETYDQPDAFEVRPRGPRTFRPHRQRVRSRYTGDLGKARSTLSVGEETMEADIRIELDDSHTETLIDRPNLCLPDFEGNSILHGRDAGFKDVLRKYFLSAESNASERLVELKSKLRNASTHDFWGILMEEICDVTGSQCGFVAKRILVDDQDSAVEMPEYGEPGSCLMATAFYINNGDDVKEMHRDYRYHAFGTPCAHMKHDKVFIIPERLSEFCPSNPNPMPWKQSEAFIGLPLFSEGKCFAHFGMIWSSEGAAKRNLGWNFIEMFLHSLEDMILQRILEGRGFSKETAPPESASAKIIPLSAITASQSLKPYARSLSHELRTPMQGVVGMLDIMYATVLDAISNQQSERVRDIFKDLKGHIEVVQDSSKRAVEAADNVVHAYDLNMQMPETPLTPVDLDMGHFVISPGSRPPSTAYSSEFPSPVRQKRDRSGDYNIHLSPPTKRMFTNKEAEILQNLYPVGSLTTLNSGEFNTRTQRSPLAEPASENEIDKALSEERGSPTTMPSSILGPAYRRIVTRDFMRSLVTDALRSGHPTSEIHIETDLGETIEVRTLSERGESQDRTIHLNIESGVPEVIITEEHHLQFSLQKVIDNAIKFTESGSITINVKLGRTSPVVEIWVIDTGCGIAEESRSSLFTPHFQEDASISRSRDGLGLSLFNAKAHVRKNLGGDVTLERSATEGPSRGSEFLIRLPISAPGTGSTDTPLVGTPTPTGVSRKGAWCDPATSSSYFLPEAISITPGTPVRRPSPSRQTSQKHIAFNPKLAEDYPLNILIAEDNAINRNVAVGSLNKLGYSKDNITLAFDGVEAVEQYKASLEKPKDQHFDAILMDIWMPNMDGYEATTKIADLAKQSQELTTIIAVTADVTRESTERAKSVGMHGWLSKPYKVLDIQNMIVEHFSKECC